MAKVHNEFRVSFFPFLKSVILPATWHVLVAPERDRPPISAEAPPVC